jgi:DNA-binding IscR family transcriptional regulator
MSVSTESPLGVRVSRAELVARELEREIAAGLEAGARLGTKDDLRKRFRVAVATVNEAVRLLETRGLIEARPGPGGGVFVARPAARIAMSHVVLGFRTGSTSYEECLELRDALEPLIDSHAARYHRARDIRELKRILKTMQASVDDPAAFFKCNWGAAPADRRAVPQRAAAEHVPGADRLSRVQHRPSRVLRLRRRSDGRGPSRPGRGNRRRRGSAARRRDRGTPAGYDAAV